MEWYLKVVKDNYANFDGRARRKEYWMFTLFHLIIITVLALISIGIASTSDTPAFMSIYFIYTLATFIPTLAVVVRRLHDIGKSGWFYLVSLIPIIGTIWMLVLLITEGESGSNQYGLDPKVQNHDEINEIGTQLEE